MKGRNMTLSFCLFVLDILSAGAVSYRLTTALGINDTFNEYICYVNLELLTVILTCRVMNYQGD